MRKRSLPLPSLERFSSFSFLYSARSRPSIFTAEPSEPPRPSVGSPIPRAWAQSNVSWTGLLDGLQADRGLAFLQRHDTPFGAHDGGRGWIVFQASAIGKPKVQSESERNPSLSVIKRMVTRFTAWRERGDRKSL